MKVLALALAALLPCLAAGPNVDKGRTLGGLFRGYIDGLLKK